MKLIQQLLICILCVNIIGYTAILFSNDVKCEEKIENIPIKEFVELFMNGGKSE